jgi:acyl carrier protein
MNVEKIYPKVAKIIADVLVLDESEISLTSRLITDLGAESIDFLDLVFQLEKEFNIKIPRGQLEKNARGELSENEFEKDGYITHEGMVALRQYLNEVPAQYFKEQMKLNEIPSLFTVETFCKLILAAKLEQNISAVGA